MINTSISASICPHLSSVECPQYSTRLEGLGCLCDCVSGCVQQVVKVICHKAHRQFATPPHHRRMVQCYSTGASNVSVPPMRAHWRHLAITIKLVHLRPTAVHKRNVKWIASIFGQPFVKRFALCYQTVVCPVCLSCL